jgi:hypothetical protein
MRLSRAILAAALVLFLTGSVPSLVLASGSRFPQVPSPQTGAFGEIWSSLRGLLALFGHEMDRLMSSDPGPGVDPGGRQSPDTDSGHDIDPNG